MSSQTKSRSTWLLVAGIYNLLWGAWVVLMPHAMFDWTGMPRLNRPEIWQCVGMIVGVYGIGYLIASRDPVRHWPIVLVGLLGKIFGPIGFAKALYDGTFPPMFGLNILTNDLIWWIPFSMLLWKALSEHMKTGDDSVLPLDTTLKTTQTQHGADLATLSESGPLLLVALRHSGCCFCRETLARLRDVKPNIPREMSVVIVTMSSASKNATLASEFGLDDVHWVSDPDRRLYRALELRRGGFLQLFGFTVMLRGIKSALGGFAVGPLDGDGFQMPGAFVVHRSRIVRAFRAQAASDSPDLESLACEVPS